MLSGAKGSTSQWTNEELSVWRKVLQTDKPYTATASSLDDGVTSVDLLDDTGPCDQSTCENWLGFCPFLEGNEGVT